jgi:hypothetical protein
MMDPCQSEFPGRRKGADQALFALRLVGLLGFLGGLTALSAIWGFGPRPQNQSQWEMMIQITRSIFFPCVFAGLVVLLVVGSILWWRHRAELHGQRWFGLMMALLAVAVPISHLAARSTMLKLRSAIETGRLDEAGMLWDQLGWAYVLSTVAMVLIASLGVIKPRLGRS